MQCYAMQCNAMQCNVMQCLIDPQAHKCPQATAICITIRVLVQWPLMVGLLVCYISYSEDRCGQIGTLSVSLYQLNNSPIEASVPTVYYLYRGIKKIFIDLYFTINMAVTIIKQQP